MKLIIIKLKYPLILRVTSNAVFFFFYYIANIYIHITLTTPFSFCYIRAIHVF